VDVLKGEFLQRITIFEAIISKLYQEELAGNKKAARARLKYFEFAASKREKQEVILVNLSALGEEPPPEAQWRR
jgi:hypothetical protein